jgi:V/A-type H+-transporting ATPase subunit I
MKKTSLIVHQNYLENVIKNLHETGLIEIINISKEDSETLDLADKASAHPDSEVCASYILRLSRLIDILKKVKPKKSGIKGMLNPDLPKVRSTEDRSLDEIYSYTEGILGEIEKNILECDQKVQNLNEMMKLIDRDVEQLNYLKEFDLNISYLGKSQYLIVRAGKTFDLESLNLKIKDISNAVIYSKQFGNGKDVEWAVVIVAHISEREKIEKICREYVTEFELENLSGKPEELKKSLENEYKLIIKDKKKVYSDLYVYSKNQLDDLLALKEEVYIENVRKEVSKNFAKTNSTYIIKGWVLEKDEKTLKETVSSVSKDHVFVNFKIPSINPDNPPTYLKTPRWAESFRTFLELFATPKYNELNPTIFMGIFFVLFFGLMLGDAGYGIVILFLSLLGYFKLGKNSPLLKTWSFLGIWLGITTTVFGFMMNSFFGDLLERYFGIQLPSLIDPLANPLIILMIALICGLIHLNLGIILGIIQKYHKREFKSLITHHFCWIPLQLGGGLLIGSFLMGFSVDGILFYFAAIMMVIGIILLMIGSGPIGFFDVTGYMGDWLSYARLLALGLATTGMALAFNVVSGLIGDMIPVIGIVITIILLVMSHIVNLALQALGAGVHSLRLQYVEFFNRFYEGGGRNFSPFEIKRIYTKNEKK